MTWSDLEDRVLVGFNHQDVSRLTVKKYLVEAQEDFILETGCLERIKWLYLTASTEYVDLPVDVIAINRVEWRGNRIEPIDIFDDHTLHQTDTSYRTGSTLEYYQQADRLYLRPGTTQTGWLTLWYVYRPNVLDTDTTYKKLSYDTLTAHFVRGETVAGGTSSHTGVVEFDDNDKKTGTLTLSSAGSTFYNDEVLAGASGGVAVTNGVATAFSTAGDDPDIDEDYRKYLPDYARAQLYEDRAIFDVSDRFIQKYIMNRENVRQKFAERFRSGPMQIKDVMRYGSYASN